MSELDRYSKSPEVNGDHEASATESAVEKGKGKARAFDPEPQEELEDDEDDDEDSDEDFDEDELDNLIEEVDMGDIVAPTSRRSARGKPIDYSSAEAMEKTGLDGKDDTVAANEEEDEEFKGDDTMEEGL